ncbi:type II toxin-antitoxin system HicA family toxin [Crocosphaera sp.]|uniref:type II toxin-antitoxin system HicA family toxin n=1 Tax=Crocosphaera sp. TaxID=2729996 RepID=UPI002606F3A9|nr:type II toxin-antitoxin system HicA family toxin [Crocosphaera sp.]MDJ0580468.1 type II toxin-antitoxin system HicA family toxin [Crocosphaera sp.]
MSKLPAISGKECIKALKKIDFLVYRQHGSHITLIRENPSTQVTIPNHRTIAKGTLRNIIRQAGLTVDEFIDLL